MRLKILFVACLLFICALLHSTILRAGDAEADNATEINAARQAIVIRVDELLANRWTAEKVQPAVPADDAEFLRRAYLDLVGVLPRVSESRAFLDDERPDKRVRLIEQLLASPTHATHLANLWRNVMLPGGVDAEQLNNAVGVQNWLRTQFAENLRYDRFVSDLLVATSGSDVGPALFYTSLDVQPEKLAAATARMFLGLQLECAQCHNHPFDHWKQEDFWGYAAFFAQLKQPGERGMDRARLVDLDVGEVKLPNSETVVPPKYLNGAAAAENGNGTRREQLSIWMASRDNPYLARAVVNRVWAQLFGRGLVEPVDDLSAHNTPSHPELFEELTRYFVRTGFDLRELYRTLANTRSYQLSSAWSGDTEPPSELFATMRLKPLTPEQAYDSLIRLLPRTSMNMVPAGQPNSPLLDPQRLAFIAKMQTPSSRMSSEYQAGILQALSLMNGQEMAMLTQSETSSLIGALASPLFNDRQRVETLFLATLSRRPTSTELERCLAHVPTDKPLSERLVAYSDLLWAILNSAEFTMNH